MTDGTYRIIAEVTEGDAVLASLEQTIHLVEGIDADAATLNDDWQKSRGTIAPRQPSATPSISPGS